LSQFLSNLHPIITKTIITKKSRANKQTNQHARTPHTHAHTLARETSLFAAHSNKNNNGEKETAISQG